MLTKQQDVEYVMSTPIHDTGTNLADHLEGKRHDQITDFLRQQSGGSMHLDQIVWTEDQMQHGISIHLHAVNVAKRAPNGPISLAVIMRGAP
jgi:hypothetical protein